MHLPMVGITTEMLGCIVSFTVIIVLVDTEADVLEDSRLVNLLKETDISLI